MLWRKLSSWLFAASLIAHHRWLLAVVLGCAAVRINHFQQIYACESQARVESSGKLYIEYGCSMLACRKYNLAWKRELCRIHSASPSYFIKETGWTDLKCCFPPGLELLDEQWMRSGPRHDNSIERVRPRLSETGEMKD